MQLQGCRFPPELGRVHSYFPISLNRLPSIFPTSPFLPLLSPFSYSSILNPLPSPQIQLVVLVKRCKLPQRSPGGDPAANAFASILGLEIAADCDDFRSWWSNRPYANVRPGLHVQYADVSIALYGRARLQHLPKTGRFH